MFNLIPKKILVSSPIAIPSELVQSFLVDLQHIRNIPNFIDITATVDPETENRARSYPHLSFFQIKEPNECYFYDPDDTDSLLLDLGDLIAIFIEKGTLFTLQIMSFYASGVNYYARNYNENGFISETTDMAYQFPELQLT